MGRRAEPPSRANPSTHSRPAARSTPSAHFDPRLVPDRERPGCWYVRVGDTDQSYIDPSDPTWLEFDYVQRVADLIDFLAEPGRRLRVVHIGGGGLTLPRYVAATRPTSAQLVFEPDASLTEAVRAVAPLPRLSGVKVRARPGREGLAELAAASADLVVVDAFSGSQTPAELTSRQWFADVARVAGPTGHLSLNLTGQAPFQHARRVVAGVMAGFGAAALAVEPSTLKGRRFGNLVVSAGPALPLDQLARRAARSPWPYRLLSGTELSGWLAGAQPFDDADAEPSPAPPPGLTRFR
ncbi:MAG: fused MFS/spermidine synthase [Propionibacteriaceae bacterium]|jgi:spermidine synthase|nr:fused MFS/spermidine synthase [Propionibacteriaceae bacterium]